MATGVTIEMPQPLGLYAGELFKLSVEYHSAFVKLDAISEPQTRRAAYFLLSHSVEICLKSFLLAKGMDKRDIKKLSHELKDILAVCVSKGLPKIGNLDCLIHHLEPVHQEMQLRYSTIYEISLPHPNECDTIMRELIEVVSRSVLVAKMRGQDELREELRRRGATEATWTKD